jgi:hypothetical protein
MLARLLGHGKRPRGHPTPKQAFAALEEGHCLYAPVNACSGRPRAVGLRHDYDSSDVLVCKAHYGRLRKLDAHSLDELEGFLKRAFAGARPPSAPSRDDSVRVVRVSRNG